MELETTRPSLSQYLFQDPALVGAKLRKDNGTDALNVSAIQLAIAVWDFSLSISYIIVEFLVT